MFTEVCGEEQTLRRTNNEDDSLCTGEFEIISCDSISHENTERHNAETPQWSTQHSINVESLVPLNNLASLLCANHSDPPTTAFSFHTAAETDHSMPRSDPSSDQASTVKNSSETAIVPENIEHCAFNVSALTDTSLSSGSGVTLEDVLRSQSETREMLELVITSLNSMKKNRSKVDDQLRTQEKTLETVDDNDNDNHSEPSSMKQEIFSLQEQLHNRGLEVDLLTEGLKKANAELEAAYQQIADLRQSNASTSDKYKKLSEELNETYALLIAERERTALAEDQLRSLQSGGGYLVANEEMVIREMREKAAYAQTLKSKLEEVSDQLCTLTKSCEDKDMELRNHVEIINVLKEEDQEARREIAEKDRRIKDLEEMVEKLGLNRAEINN